MQQEWQFLPELSREWRSKLFDGVLATVVLCLTWLIVTITIRPVEVAFGAPGLLVYALGLVAAALYGLQQALSRAHSEPTRAWFGMAGGILAWTVISVCTHLGLPAERSAELIMLIMAALVVALLWRVLPVGPRFFGLAFLLNWLENIIIGAGEALVRYSPVFDLLFRATGYLAILFIALGLGWMLFLTRRRIERISGALGLWFLASLALYVFQGGSF